MGRKDTRTGRTKLTLDASVIPGGGIKTYQYIVVGPIPHPVERRLAFYPAVFPSASLKWKLLHLQYTWYSDQVRQRLKLDQIPWSLKMWDFQRKTEIAEKNIFINLMKPIYHRTVQNMPIVMVFNLINTSEERSVNNVGNRSRQCLYNDNGLFKKWEYIPISHSEKFPDGIKHILTAENVEMIQSWTWIRHALRENIIIN